MRKTGFITLGLAAIILLIGFLPDRTEKVQFFYKGEDIVQRIDTEYSDVPIFTGGEAAKEIIRNSNLVIDAKIPKSILKDRQSHVQMTAQWIEANGTSQMEAVPDGITLQIKSHLDFPRQFVEPNGFNFKPITFQDSPAFHWNLWTDKSDSLKGTLWIYLIMQNKQGLSIEYPLLGRDIEIPVTTLLGMTLVTSRVVSLCFGFFGMAVLLFDKFRGKNKHIKNY